MNNKETINTSEEVLKDYYILIKPWGVFVKEGEFFISQGGTIEPWGNNWKCIQATSIEHARKIGEEMRKRNEQN